MNLTGIIRIVVLLETMILLLFPLFQLLSATGPQISRDHKEGTISFYRNLFDDDQKESLSNLKSALFGGIWKYYDYERTPKDGVPWQLPVNVESLSKSELWKIINKILPMDKTRTTDHVDARARLMRRGDNVRINTICSDLEEGYSIVLFLSKLNDKNDYGEVLFFENDDIHSTIQPVQYGVLVWPCRTPYQFQYPSISTGFGQVFLHITIYNKIDVKPEYLSHDIKDFPTFSGLNSLDRSFNVQDHVTSTTYTALKRPIYVLDGLFPTEMLEELRGHIYHSSMYFYDDSDDAGETDNVHWISGYKTHHFVKSEMWRVINTTISQITGHTGWYPYDVSCNLNRAWDHTRIHKDCYFKDEYTFLLYLNPGFKPGDLAGTVWYEHEDVSEIVSSVQNKYGRVALFHCEIKHAGRPPHAYLTDARYTFAVKVARDKLDAVKREMSSTVLNDHEEDEQDDVLLELVKEMDSDPDRLEQKFVEMFEQQQEQRLEGMDEALRTAANQ